MAAHPDSGRPFDRTGYLGPDTARTNELDGLARSGGLTDLIAATD